MGNFNYLYPLAELNQRILGEFSIVKMFANY